MGEFDKLKRSCYEANIKLPELGLVMFTFGNVSEADQSRNVFAIKPSGVPYDSLKPEDMVIVDFDNQIVEGKLRPSSDTKTHAMLYRNWSGVNGIVHTHSTYAVAWAQAGLDIPILGTTHADHHAGDIPCTDIMSDEMIIGDYEYETGVQIIQEMTARSLNPENTEMLLVANHGPFTWGKTVAQAVYNSAVLEEIARIAYLTMQINPDARPLKETLIRKHYERKHGKDAYYGQSKNQ
jgi:L-ribulose-5-phosphate 4-epimerase